MRVFASGIVTETNTFAPMPTGMADYDVTRAADLRGQRSTVGGEGSTIDVFRELTEQRGWEFIFGLYAVAEPSGITVRAVYESLRDEILEALRAALPVDIVLLPLHGAMVAEGYDDCEGDLTARVREIVGPNAKIGVELDLHCHLTQKLLDESDAVVLYKEYPHTDITKRAADLFRLVADAAEGKTKPKQALYDCRMLGLYMTPFEPMRSFVDEMYALEGKDGILSVSLGHCFPWGDVPDCGVRTMAITDGDVDKAAQVARQLGQKFFEMRHEVTARALRLEEALERALEIPSGPVVIADQSDNPGGGAPSDSTFALRALLERGITNAGVAMIWDPIAVQIAMAAGEGAALALRLGGKMGPMSGDPLDLRVTVRGLLKDMIQEFPQGDQPPLQAPCGDSAWLECSGIDIIVNSRRGQVFSPQVFTNFGIDVHRKRILIVKSTQHFYAGFAPIASRVLYMAAPGAIPPLMTEIPYKRVDRNKYPIVENPFA